MKAESMRLIHGRGGLTVVACVLGYVITLLGNTFDVVEDLGALRGLN
jgi:hypothetical protein